MINKIFFGILIAFFAFITLAVPISAAETETVRGVVLDEEGNGMELREDGTPIDPYYNYISYKGVEGVKPGQIIITVATLDEYGDWDDRRDFPTTESVNLKKYLKIKELDEELTKLVW